MRRSGSLTLEHRGANTAARQFTEERPRFDEFGQAGGANSA